MYTKIQELLTNTFEIMKCYDVSTCPAIEKKNKNLFKWVVSQKKLISEKLFNVSSSC